MNSDKEKLLYQTFDIFVKTCFSGSKVSDIEKWVDPKVMGFGTAIDEKVRDIEEFARLLANQNNQTAGMELTYKTIPIERRITNDENTVVFADDFYLYLTTEEETIEFYLRMSIVMSYSEGKWMVIHWHGSKPEMVENETDSWGFDAYKKKTEELEKLVDEKTSDLIEKNRELEIETSLEKVRGSMMSMTNSSELLQVIKSVFTELQSLGFSADACAVIIYNENDGAEHWYSGYGTEIYPKSYTIPYTKKFSYNYELVDAWKKGVNYESFVMEGQLKLDYAIWLIENSDFGELPEEFLVHAKSKEQIVLNDAFNKYGMLEILGPEPLSTEDAQILIRFSKVFEQTYTRFLDLKKAEEQAREAQVEAALERIRAHAMSMSKSDDLLDVVVTLRNEFTRLGHAAQYFWHMMWLSKTYEKAMTSIDGTRNGFVMTLPRHIHGDIPLLSKWEKSKQPTVVYAMDVEEAISYVEKMIHLGDFKNIDPNAPSHDDIKKLGGITFVMARTSHGEIGYSLPGVVKQPPIEDLEILVRFAGAFDLAHRRFLDLQISEKQAKEVKIELALEKVRSRAMAMQESKELSSVVDTLLNEFTKLEWNLTFCIINIINEKDRTNTVWAANPETGQDAESYHMIFEDYEFHHELWSAWKARKEKWVYTIEGEEKRTYDEYLFNETEFRRFPEDVKSANIALKRYVAGFTFCNFGGLQTVSEDDISEDDLDILTRFGKVFEQAYTRFLDIKKAEEQAHEAKIEAALERVRSQSIGMQSTNDFAEVTTEMFNQLRKFGEELFATGIVFCDKHEGHVEQWHSIPGGGMLSPMIVPIDLDYIHQYRYDQWKAEKELFSIEIPSDFIKQHFEDIFKLPSAQKTLKDLESRNAPMPEPPPWEIDYGASFKHGYILISSLKPIENPDILPRFAKVFDQAYTRFLDLQRAEEQAREAQINLAVERVRAKALAMHKSEEIMSVVAKLKDEVMSLDIPNVVAATIFLNEGDDKVRMWDLSTLDINDNNDYEVPFDFTFKLKKKDPHLYVKRVWENTDDYFVELQKGKDFKRIVAWLRENDQLKVADEVEEYVENTQLKGLYHAAKKLNNGKLVIDLMDPPSEEMQTILTKMGAAFDLAYKRFEDLQKAESQTREAQIEMALEKVRSRTMAMQSSLELPEAANSLFLEVQALGIPAWSAGYNILSEDKTSSTCIMSSEGEIQVPFILPLTEHDSLKPWHEAIIDNKEFFVYGQEDEDLVAHYNYMKTLPGLEEVFQQFQDAGIDLPTCQFNHLVKFSEGFLLFITYEAVPNAHSIFKRFGKVFEQTYTRFLDLQKAEEQTREAQIEAALERVRARSLAMHKSEDLKEVIQVVYQQFVNLNLPVEHAGFILDYKERDDMHIWFASLQTEPTEITIPYFDSPHWNSFLEAKTKGKTFFPNLLDFETKNKFYQDLFKWIPPLSNEAVDSIFNKPGLVISTVLMDNVGLYIENYGTTPYTDAENAILLRFGQVFQQTYTRFLDLQKAEKQAREAKILASLERVRATTMAMHHSEELSTVLSTLFEQFDVLGINPSHAVLTLINKEKNTLNFRTTGKQGYKVYAEQEVDLNVVDSWIDTTEKWKKSKPNAVNVNEYPPEVLPEVWDTYKDVLEAMPKNARPEIKEFPNGLFITEGYCRFGYIGFAHNRKPTEEEKDIVRRMAAEFGTLYQRFLDLETAEKNAYKSKVETALERVRARALAMQEPDELKEVAHVLRTEMGLLGIEELETSSIYILDKDTNKAECWYAIKDVRSSDKKLVSDHISMDFKQTWVGQQMRDFHDTEAQATSIVMSGEQRIEWIRYCEEQSQALQGYYGEQIPDRTYHLYKFSNGAIGAASAGDISEESWELLQRSASVFSLAYSRFKDLTQAKIDLKRLKAAKKKAEEALAELQMTQQQLIQSEKMASLGELTAGIAHEIQNPLNFVNNFSDVSKELLEEMQEEIDNGDFEEVKAIMEDVVQNLEKINHHGQRADSIVKGMLQHSRTGGDKKELTDINALADEYLRLAYHGMRAKDKSFNAEIKNDLEKDLPSIPVIPQDIGRVILNLLTNGFYACQQKAKGESKDYTPTVGITTKKAKGKVLIEVSDNGGGIPSDIQEKIFQPFYTTKPTGQGTGLGLSMSYDIITKSHNGSLEVESTQGMGTTFIINLPLNTAAKE